MAAGLALLSGCSLRLIDGFRNPPPRPAPAPAVAAPAASPAPDSEAQARAMYRQRAEKVLGAQPDGILTGPARRQYDANLHGIAWRLYLLNRAEGRCPAACEPGASGTAPAPASSPQYQF